MIDQSQLNALERNITQLMHTLRDARSENDNLQNQIDFTQSEDIVSTDLVGSRHAGVVDGQATIVNPADPVLARAYYIRAGCNLYG